MSPESPAPPTAILVVDDETHILRAIKRVLRRDRYHVHLADNGEAALELLDEHEIAVMICDQRMPGMSGAEVLAEAYKRSPETYRITLTGFTDLDAAQSSINDGRIHRFLTKPWDDKQLRDVVADGVRAFELVHENRRLQELTRQQNDELRTWNVELEARVAERTQQLAEHNNALEAIQAQLRDSLRDTIALLGGLLEAYDPRLGVHSKRVAELCLRLAESFELSAHECFEIECAGHLHDIGMISRLTKTSPGAAKDGPRPDPAACGWALLSKVRGFERIAEAIQHQTEHYDGSGGVRGLARDRIPLASRIIAVADAFDTALHDDGDPRRTSVERARKQIEKLVGSRLDPGVVARLHELLDADALVDQDVVEVSPPQLRPRMILARDLERVTRVLLLRAETVLTPANIERIQALAADHMLLTGVFVYAGGAKRTKSKTDDDESQEIAA